MWWPYPILLFALLSAPGAHAVGRPVTCAEALLYQHQPPLALRRVHRNENRRGFRRVLLGPGLHYLTDLEMTRHEVFVRDGLLVDARGRPFDGEGMYVLTEDGRLIVRHDRDGLHHSSLAAGRAVFCAGFVRVRDGGVRWLDNSSGHYHPSEEHLIDFVAFLLARRVPIGANVLLTHQLRLLRARHGERLPPEWR